MHPSQLSFPSRQIPLLPIHTDRPPLPPASQAKLARMAYTHLAKRITATQLTTESWVRALNLTYYHAYNCDEIDANLASQQ